MNRTNATEQSAETCEKRVSNFTFWSTFAFVMGVPLVLLWALGTILGPPPGSSAREPAIQEPALRPGSIVPPEFAKPRETPHKAQSATR
jgi:hypothetical protein